MDLSPDKKQFLISGQEAEALKIGNQPETWATEAALGLLTLTNRNLEAVDTRIIAGADLPQGAAKAAMVTPAERDRELLTGIVRDVQPFLPDTRKRTVVDEIADYLRDK